MRTKETALKKPVTVMQVFYHVHQFTKAEKTFSAEKQALKKTGISSQSGFIENDTLFLPENIIADPLFTNPELITLEDHAGSTKMPDSIFYPQPPLLNRCIAQGQKCKIFVFHLHSASPPKLHLNYEDFEIGLPRRDNFLLCTLKENEAVEIRINGKNDFSLTGRRQRSYKEQAFVFMNLGSFQTIRLLPQNFVQETKQIPTKRKLIDLRKPLW